MDEEAVEFTQTKCREAPYAGNKLRIETSDDGLTVKVALISESGNVIDEETFKDTHAKGLRWILNRGNW